MFSPSFPDILINFLVSLGCGFIISLVYRFTYKGPGYSGNFVNSIIFLSVITTLVVMIIGNNLARAFGLVGALSIIRFRTAIKDPIDIAYIFLALTIGMAGGVGYHKLSIAGTILCSIIMIVFSNDRLSIFLSDQHMLQFSRSNEEGANEDDHLRVLSGYCLSYEVLNLRTNDIEHAIEYSYYIRLKKSKDPSQLLKDLQKIKGLTGVNLFYDQQNS